MEPVSDILLGIGALAAAIYCYILGRRLRRFRNLDEGMGAAIGALSTQVGEMSQALDRAQAAAGASAANLDDLTQRAERAAGRLELLIASLHDIPAGSEHIAPGPGPGEDRSPPRHSFAACATGKTLELRNEKVEKNRK